MRKRANNEVENQTKTNGGFMAFMSFVALIVFAVLEVLNGLNLITDGLITDILKTIENVCIIIVFGVNAFSFIKNKAKGYKIIYWISIAVFVVGTILIWINLGNK